MKGSLGSLGAIAGALVGDAAGATLEFYQSGKITDSVARKAMRMPGGGSLGVGPGQITDDGELTLALASALAKGEYVEDEVAKAYSAWHKSEPFDMGHTTSRAFGFAKTAAEMRSNAQKYNMLSEANGQLMRCTPIPVFLHGKQYFEIAEIARSDALLSHPSKVCQDCAALYSVVIAFLINNPFDVEVAIKMAENFNGISPMVKDWLESSSKPLKDLADCRINAGHVKHAFTLAFHFLRKRSSYEDAIRETLKLGGDTDTNACIVGGMIGALHGLHAIPDHMTGPVFEFDPVTYDIKKTLIGHRRPAVYKASNIFKLIRSPK